MSRLRVPRAACILFLASVLLSSCGPATPAPTPQVIDVYATAAAGPWLSELYDCAARESVVLRLSDLRSAAIVLRIGQPADLTAPAYQVDTDDIQVVTNRESPVQNLSADEARKLFAQGEPGAQVWVFAPGEDIQQIFEQEIMRGAPITSLARLAANPGHMSDTLNAEQDAVGILPRHWRAGTVRDVYTIPDVPVLAILRSEPQGVVRDLLSCLQK